MPPEIWFVKKDQQGPVYGPLSSEQLREYWQTGKISATMLLSSDKQQWIPAEQVMARQSAASAKRTSIDAAPSSLAAPAHPATVAKQSPAVPSVAKTAAPAHPAAVAKQAPAVPPVAKTAAPAHPATVAKQMPAASAAPTSQKPIPLAIPRIVPQTSPVQPEPTITSQPGAETLIEGSAEDDVNISTPGIFLNDAEGNDETNAATMNMKAMKESYTPPTSSSVEGSDVATYIDPIEPNIARQHSVLPYTAQKFNQYEIIQELGRGGMGVVYKAMDTLLQRVVALKVLLNRNNDENAQQRFLREARMSAKLSHQNIVHLYEVGSQPQSYLVMEFVEGRSYADLLKKQTYTLQENLEIFRQVCDAVEYAHKQQIIHRDLKPQNIMVTTDNVPKVMDFGLAKSLSRDNVNLSVEGQVLGTPKYMSPEQADGRQVNHSTDIYSLGVILYEILTGRTPYEGDTIITILSKLATETPDLPCRINASIPEELQTICMKCLEKKPEDRYVSAQILSNDIKAFLNKTQISARPSAKLGHTTKGKSRKKTSIGVLILLVLVAMILKAVFTQSPEEKDYRVTKTLAWQSKEKEAYPEAIQLCQDFLDRHPKTRHREEVAQNIAQLKELQAKKEEAQDYSTTQNRITQAKEKEQYPEAIELCQTFLTRYPKTIHRQEIEQSIAQFKELQAKQEEEQDYNTTQNRASKAKEKEAYPEAIRLCQGFLIRHPKTIHRQEIEQSIAQLKELQANLDRKKPDAQESSLKSYDFTPLSVGRQWVYELETREGIAGTQTTKIEVKIVEEKNGKYSVTHIQKQNQMQNKDHQEWYREGDFFMLYSSNQKNTYRVLKYPVRMDSTWDSSTGDKDTLATIVETNMTVEVPAGTFHHCIKIMHKPDTSRPVLDNIGCLYEYYAPSVGKIKSEKILGLRRKTTLWKEELISYKK